MEHFLNASKLQGSVKTFETFSPDMLSKVLFLKAQTTGLEGSEEACVPRTEPEASDMLSMGPANELD